jgi:hypothetical protein
MVRVMRPRYYILVSSYSCCVPVRYIVVPSPSSHAIKALLQDNKYFGLIASQVCVCQVRSVKQSVYRRPGHPCSHLPFCVVVTSGVTSFFRMLSWFEELSFRCGVVLSQLPETSLPSVYQDFCGKIIPNYLLLVVYVPMFRRRGFIEPLASNKVKCNDGTEAILQGQIKGVLSKQVCIACFSSACQDQQNCNTTERWQHV